MPRRDRVMEAIDQMAAAAKTSPALARPLIIKGLASKAAPVLAKAAELARRHRLEALAPAVTAAAEYWFAQPLPKDPGCIARSALMSAMRQLEIDAKPLYRQAVVLRQIEGSFGTSVDAAVSVRADAALALTGAGDLGAPMILGAMLFEEEDNVRVEDNPAARVAAAQGLGLIRLDDAAYLLRTKLNAGDRYEQVLAECVAAMVRIGPGWTMTFLKQWLATAAPDVVASAALVVCETRSPMVVPLLMEMYRRTQLDACVAEVLLSLSITRMPEAIDFLLDRAANGPPAEASSARKALEIHHGNASIRERIDAVL